MLTMLTERDGVFSPPERRGKSMKQTVAVMAIILALLLMVSGYIVAEHAETTAELRRMQEQLGEKQVELQKAKREKQLFESRAEELEKQLADAKASIDEANAAVAQTVDERAQAEAAFAGQNQLLEAQAADWENRYQELMGQNNRLTAERDAALQQAEACQTELNSLQGEYGSLLEEKNGLQASIDSAQNRIIELESGAESQILEISDLQEQKSALEAALSALREELARVRRVSRPVPERQ